MTDFPFDTQSCSIFLGSWTHDSTHLNLTSSSKFAKQVYGPFSRNPEWIVLKKDVFSADLNASEVAVWHTVGIELLLKRRNDMYMYRIGIPYFTAWAFALFAFLSDVGSRRRLLFTSLAILIFHVLLTQLSWQLGPHSIHIPYAIKCLGVSLTVISLSFILSTVAHVLVRKMVADDVILPHSVSRLLQSRLIQSVCCLKEPGMNSHSNSSRLLDPRSAESMGREWQLALQLLDRLSFLLLVITTICYHS